MTCNLLNDIRNAFYAVHFCKERMDSKIEFDATRINEKNTTFWA